jgi:hypothetical protein
VKNTIQQSRWKHFVLSILFFAVAFIVGTFLQWPTADPGSGWMIFVKFGAVFGLLGAMYGAIYALDIRGNSANSDRPLLRTVVCAGLGGLLVFSLEIPSLTGVFEPIVLGAGVSGFLGWLGWRWAKHVDFKIIN